MVSSLVGEAHETHRICREFVVFWMRLNETDSLDPSSRLSQRTTGQNDWWFFVYINERLQRIDLRPIDGCSSPRIFVQARYPADGSSLGAGRLAQVPAPCCGPRSVSDAAERRKGEGGGGGDGIGNKNDGSGVNRTLTGWFSWIWLEERSSI